MKRISLILALIALVAFSSCNKVEDGAYTPKKRIVKTYYEDFYTGDKKLGSVWNWDGKKLQAIDYYWGNELHNTEYYTYNKDGRIETVVDKYYDETIKYEYDGNKLSKAFFYEDGYIEYEYDFVYDGKKISEISCTASLLDYYKNDSKNMRFDPLAMILPQIDMNYVNAFAKKVNISKGDVKIKLEWDGDNVSKMSIMETIEGFTVGIKMEYKYDDKINPFKNILAVNLEEAINFECSKNNATELTITEIYGPESDTYTEFITYTYDGKYPITINLDGELNYIEYE